jgi:hypothetical protein
MLFRNRMPGSAGWILAALFSDRRLYLPCCLRQNEPIGRGSKAQLFKIGIFGSRKAAKEF